MGQVIIGVDPHKLSATIEVVEHQEKLLGSGRFSTDRAGYTAMRMYAKSWPDRVWAVEGANGAGRPLAQRLLEAGEHVVDVPAKLAARVHCGASRESSAVDLPPAHRHFGSATSRTRNYHAIGHRDSREAPPGLGSPAAAPTRRSRQGGAPHRTNDLDGDKRRRTLQRADPGSLTTEGSRYAAVWRAPENALHDGSRGDARPDCCDWAAERLAVGYSTQVQQREHELLAPNG